MQQTLVGLLGIKCRSSAPRPRERLHLSTNYSGCTYMVSSTLASVTAPHFAPFLRAREFPPPLRFPSPRAPSFYLPPTSFYPAPGPLLLSHSAAKNRRQRVLNLNIVCCLVSFTTTFASSLPPRLPPRRSLIVTHSSAASSFA